MRKIVKIDFLKTHQIICSFENGETRILNLLDSIKDKYVDKIVSNEQIFRAAKIGKFGEVYWSGIAEITELNGDVTPCEYDISPEFIYVNSKPIKTTTNNV